MLTTIGGRSACPAGPVELGVAFEYDGGGLGKGGAVRLTVNGDEVAQGGWTARCPSCSR